MFRVLAREAGIGTLIQLCWDSSQASVAHLPHPVIAYSWGAALSLVIYPVISYGFMSRVRQARWRAALFRGLGLGHGLGSMGCNSSWKRIAVANALGCIFYLPNTVSRCRKIFIKFQTAGTASDRTSAFSSQEQDEQPGGNHQAAEQLAHGKKIEEKSELRVGLAEQLHKRTEEPVEQEKQGQK